MAQDQQFAQQQQQQQQQNPCVNYSSFLVACLKENSGNISMCQQKMDMLSQCEKDYGLRPMI
jgi:hypothetical protein